jgi:hypothetical protein
MKKRLNIIFFSICFLAAIIAEAYCLTILEGDLFSVIGISLVVLITGYLLLDSIGSKLIQSKDNLKFYLDHAYRDETEKWSERYEEMINLQKASYTAGKKNSAIISEGFDSINKRLESLELKTEKAMLKITELQIKSLEGQKNAVNLEIKYQKENTKQLIQALREENNLEVIKEQLEKILTNFEYNNDLIQKLSFSASQDSQSGTTGNIVDSYKDEDENYRTESAWNDSIESQFASQKEEVDDSYLTYNLQEELNEAEETSDMMLERLISEGLLSTETGSMDEEVLLETSFDASANENQITAEPEQETAVIPTIAPLYDDPNKALSADEIAKLFASFGQ